jgi:hypothetical protein
MSKEQFIEFINNYVGELSVLGKIALDVNTGVFYY